jgi:hypothetical protein
MRIEERHEVDRIGVRRQRLVHPVERTAPIDDLINLGLRLSQHFLPHQFVVDGGHAPDHGLDGAARDGTAGQVFWREGLSAGRHCRPKCNECEKDCSIHGRSSVASF